MKNVGYYNGIIKPLEELAVPALDRAVYFGDGVYDAVFVSGGVMFTLDLHIDRLYNSCKLLEIPFEMDRGLLVDEIKRTLVQFDGGDALLYIQISRGTASRAHEFPKNGATPNLLMMIKPISVLPRGSKIKLLTVEDTRFFHCNIKTINLLPNVFAAQRAKEGGCTEAVFHRGERVTECAHSALLMIKDGVLVAPPLDELVLPSITRAIIFKLCEENGIKTEVRAFTVEEMMGADEVLVCSTTKHLVSAKEIDGKAVGGKNKVLLEKLTELFFRKLENEIHEGETAE